MASSYSGTALGPGLGPGYIGYSENYLVFFG